MTIISDQIQSRTLCITHPQLYLQSFTGLLYLLFVVSYKLASHFYMYTHRKFIPTSYVTYPVC